MAKTESITRFYLLDFSRGFAAFVMLFWHYQHFFFTQAGSGPQFSSISVQPGYEGFSLFYNYGYAAVEYFWILSGFVLTNAYFQQKTKARDFFIMRFSRIYPLHFLTLLVVAALQFVSMNQLGHWQIYGNNDLYHFILHLFIASDWGFQNGYSFNSPIWSVSLEEVIYAVFFCSLPFIHRFKSFATVGIALAFFALQAFRVPGAFWWCGFYFFAGSSLYHFYRVFSKSQLILLSACLASFIASYFLLSQVGWNADFTQNELLCFYTGLAAIFAGILLILVVLEKYATSAVAKVGKVAGELSFGMYLWHIPIQILVLTIMQLNEISMNDLNGWLFLSSFIVVTISIAYVSFKYYEAPMRSKIRSRI